MIELSGCKINLGLNVVARRADGYHDLETVMYPISTLRDVVEVQRGQGKDEFSQSGIVVDCPAEKNICLQALRLLQGRYGIGSARVHLHKVVPMGAGLGGGSANGVAVLKLCNSLWGLGLDGDTLRALALELGSDTAFFVDNTPALCQGRGDILTPLALNLSRYRIEIIKPEVSISTAEAYAGIVPKHPLRQISDIVQLPVEQWRGVLHNDFEDSVFARHPMLGDIKQQFYDRGALYASMSGSGSAIYGIF